MGCNSRQIIKSLKTLETRELDNQIQNSIDPHSRVQNNNLESILKRPLKILATSSSVTTDMVQKMASLSDDKDKPSKSFKKVAPKYRQMLLIAASQGEVVPTELPQDAMNFFTQSSVLHAQIFLNSMLEMERIDCSITPAMI